MMKHRLVNDKTTYTVCILQASFEKSSWRYTLIAMVAFAFQPVIMPVIILLSKLLKRRIMFFPVEIDRLS